MKILIIVVLLIILTGCVEKDIVDIIKETPSETETVKEEIEEVKVEEKPEVQEPEPVEEVEEIEMSEDKKTDYIWINRDDFEPSELNITKGTKVIWINDDNIGRIFKQIGKGFRSPIIDAGETFEHTFNESEVFRYADLNFGTKGRIIVE
ncbi:MAG: hypothetical protein QF362_04225 [Candidatus Woesearchaeota archaeon]|jgi:plastocyanin|nr:hypothetical protein [Candidatus Woesearchaeota archaeon]MDP7506620.1 hypothetical protein [Candidatus Woesearchaeota archaeon]MDP7610197.1 hypothetical protein [Candidatus Woesearchaeota archaeon]|tara:strand:- start:558 stop:1007 length:450 start_codon:yes stop_codon:yes gene_type:complete